MDHHSSETGTTTSRHAALLRLARNDTHRPKGGDGNVDGTGMPVPGAGAPGSAPAFGTSAWLARGGQVARKRLAAVCVALARGDGASSGTSLFWLACIIQHLQVWQAVSDTCLQWVE
jgi:hypothetical protein